MCTRCAHLRCVIRNIPAPTCRYGLTDWLTRAHTVGTYRPTGYNRRGHCMYWPYGLTRIYTRCIRPVDTRRHRPPHAARPVGRRRGLDGVGDQPTSYLSRPKVCAWRMPWRAHRARAPLASPFACQAPCYYLSVHRQWVGHHYGRGPTGTRILRWGNLTTTSPAPLQQPYTLYTRVPLCLSQCIDPRSMLIHQIY